MSALPVRMLLPFPAIAGVLLLMLGVALDEAGSEAGRPVLVAGVVMLVSVALMFWRTVAGGVMAAGVWMIFMAWSASLVPAEYGPGRGQVLLMGGLGVVTVLVGLRFGRRPSTRTIVAHQSERSDRNDGVASRWQLLRYASTWPIRAKAKVLRPCLQAKPFWKRPFVAINELATKVATVGMLGVWSACEDVVVYLGGPRTFKTATLACRILDAPGAVIATSTRLDLIKHTAAWREAHAGPTYVFNPSGMGEVASTITFDPIAGCADPVTANDRAGDLLSAAAAPGAGDDRAYWTEQAQRVLATLMHAAALAGDGVSMSDVSAWVADPDGSKDEIQRYLRRSPEPSFVTDSLQFLNTNDRTRSSICSTIMPALGWLTNPTAKQAATGGGFDVAKLLKERGTVYMLGAKEAKTAPLVTALTGHIAREARAIAARMRDGRLDPPLTLVLDEAALICPVPLEDWTADMGGRNITIHIAAQSKAQLESKFGERAAATILNNTATLLLFGGTKDDKDLQSFCTLIGERVEDVETVDESTGNVSTTNRRVGVFTPAQLKELPKGHVVIVPRNMPSAIGRIPMVWKRWDLRLFNLGRTTRARAGGCREGLVAAYAWTAPRARKAYADAQPHVRAAREAARTRFALVAQLVQERTATARAWLIERSEALADRVLTLKRQPLRADEDQRAVVYPAPIPLPPAAADVEVDLSGRPQRPAPSVDELVDDDADATVTKLSDWKRGDAS